MLIKINVLSVFELETKEHPAQRTLWAAKKKHLCRMIINNNNNNKKVERVEMIRCDWPRTPIYLQCIQPTCRSFVDFSHNCFMIITEWSGECGNISFFSAIYARKLPCKQQPTSPSTSDFKWHQASVQQTGNTHGCPFAAQRWHYAAGQDKGLVLQIQGYTCAVWTFCLCRSV